MHAPTDPAPVIRPLVLSALAVGLALCPPSARAEVIWWEAEAFARSNWPGGREGTGWFAPADDAQTAKLSGGVWLNVGGKRDEALFAEYVVDVPQAGTYRFYVRKFWHHGPFRWRVDRGAWRDASGRFTLLDSVSLRKNLGADWIMAGKVDLTAGRHTLRVELLDNDGAAAFDCFVLADGPFTPRGALKPGEKLGLADPGTWAFEPGIDPFGEDCLLDLSSLNEDVAGQSGRVTCREGRFHLGSGEPVRFWGTNIHTHGHDLADLRYQAKRLAKLGVNQVRFFQRLWAGGGDSAITDVNERTLAGAHRVVAAMRDEGIYTTLCPFFVLNFRIEPGWNVPGFPDGGTKPFGLLFWDETLQNAYKAWVRELMTRPNPHTGVPLAKDPAVHFFQIQNEDSLFFWTFMDNIPLAQQEVLGKQYGDWLVAKYGSLDAALAAWGGPGRKLTTDKPLLGDHFDRGVAGFLDVYRLTSKTSIGASPRAADQRAFMAHVQREFNEEMTRFLRDACGYDGLIAANVWRTADPLTLMDIERYTYTTNDVIDKHNYFAAPHVNPDEGHRASYTVDPGDLFISQSVLRNPRSLPTNTRMVAGLPHTITECTWPQPNRYKAEAPLLIAAYAALTDLDGFFWFATGSLDYDRDMTKFQVNLPSIMGQWPGAALLYRRHLVATAPVVVAEQRPLDDLWAGRFPIIAEDAGYDPNRDMSRPELAPPTTVDPLAYLVGRVEVTYDAPRRAHDVAPLDPYIDRPSKTVTSATGQLALDYGRGLMTINAPAAQGATGFFAETGPVTLDALTIRSGNDYGAVLAVALDGKPLADSGEILLQAMTHEWLHGFRTEAAPVPADGNTSRPGRRIADYGRAPWNVADIDVAVTVGNPSLRKATVLDPHGYPLRTLDLSATDGGVTVTLPTDALYTLLH
ncbi:MAG: hypothetical protein ACOC7R_00335 [Planctomycetota bacterium]